MKASFFSSTVLAVALALSVGVTAAQDKPNTLSDKASEAFGKLKPLSEAKNFDGMLAVMDAVQPQVAPDSYDLAMILDLKAKLYAQKEQFDKAIDAWDTALRIAEPKKFFDQKDILEKTLYLAQFSYQVGTSSKVPAVQRQYTDKAAGYFKKWLAATPKPPADISMFYASILYNQAVIDPKKVDASLLKQARAEVEKGIANSIHPKEGFYVLLLAILQQENDSVHSAELLELLVKEFPAKKDYWPSLWATYLNMANEASAGEKKDENKVRENQIRSINTMERAQALGLMKTTKDNLTLVGLYLNVNQFGYATDLLYKGLKSGAIESDEKNWLTLGYYYQQADNPKKAIDSLREASKLFPNTGAFDLQIGQVYQSMEKTKEARDAFRDALKRGHLDKPYFALMSLAYACYELEDYDEALSTVQTAEKMTEGQKDAQLPKLKFAIEASIKERDQLKAIAAKKSL